MARDPGRRHTISEVSERTGVAVHLLRQWEERFPQLKPRRTRTNRRYYTEEDIAVVQRIRELLRQEGMTTEGARRRLADELRGEGSPRTNQEMLDLVDHIEREVRAMLDQIDQQKRRP
jgi:DNA-binding transcriptional MerR regulator